MHAFYRWHVTGFCISLKFKRQSPTLVPYTSSSCRLLQGLLYLLFSSRFDCFESPQKSKSVYGELMHRMRKQTTKLRDDRHGTNKSYCECSGSKRWRISHNADRVQNVHSITLPVFWCTLQVAYYHWCSLIGYEATAMLASYWSSLAPWLRSSATSSQCWFCHKMLSTETPTAKALSHRSRCCQLY